MTISFISIPFVFVIIGLVLYFITDGTKHPEAKEVGRLMFAYSWLVLMAQSVGFLK